MSAQEVSEYLSRLLGRSVGPDDVVTLSSGQQARCAGWLVEHGHSSANLRAILSKPFTTSALTGGQSATGNAVPPAATGVPYRIAGAAGGCSLGIDLQNVDELVPTALADDAKSSAELLAIFTMRELSYAQAQPSASETLAGLFAAKEALRKCDNRLMARALPQIEILPDESGHPNFPGFALSISHSGGIAAAVAISAGPARMQMPPPQIAVVPAAQKGDVPPSPENGKYSWVELAFRIVAIAGAIVAFTLAFQRFGFIG